MYWQHTVSGSRKLRDIIPNGGDSTEKGPAQSVSYSEASLQCNIRKRKDSPGISLSLSRPMWVLLLLLLALLMLLCVLSLSPVLLPGKFHEQGDSDSATPWTAARQGPLCMGFSSQEYWNGFPFPPTGDLSNPGIAPVPYASCIGRQILYNLSHLRSPGTCKHHSHLVF